MSAVPPKVFTTSQLQARTLKPGEKVRLVSDLPGLPAGARGKVAMANGFTWKRYWVRFAADSVVGHIDHGDLVRDKHYERFLVAREREAELALLPPAADDDTGDDTAAASAEADGGGDVMVNGVTVPAYLLQRSADARARLGA